MNVRRTTAVASPQCQIEAILHHEITVRLFGQVGFCFVRLSDGDFANLYRGRQVQFPIPASLCSAASFPSWLVNDGKSVSPVISLQLLAHSHKLLPELPTLFVFFMKLSAILAAALAVT
jgi:hypothetical protein